MADNVLITPGSGDIVAADDIAGAKHQRVKITVGTDGVNDGDVSSSNPMPTTVSGTVTVDGSGVTQPVSGTVSVTGVSTAANQSTQITAEQAIQTAVELIDDTVATLGTTTYTEASTKGVTIGAVRRDADTTLVNTTNEVGPLQMDANGRLKVEAFSGETLPVSLTSTTVTGTVAVTQSGTWDEVGINDSGNSITVDNGGTFATQVDGAALTALQLIDDPVATDDTTTHSTGTTKVMGIGAVATPTDASVNANDIGMPAMTTDRKLHVSVQDSLPAGTNAIGKLSANSGVDIGDVDVTTVGTITPGTAATSLGKAEDAAHSSGDTGVYALAVRDDVPAAHSGADGDYESLHTNRDGMLWVTPGPQESDLATQATTHVKKYYTNAGAVTDGIIWSPAAGKRWYVTDIFINVSAAATVTLEDDLAAGDSVVWKAELAANSGWSHSYETPLYSGEDAADLLITTSAGNVYVTVTGYEI